MRQLILFLSFLFFVQNSFSQSKEKVDSINNIIVNEIKIPLDELIEIFKKNIADAEKLDYKEGKALALSKLSTAYNYRGDSYDKSTEALLSAIRIYESLEIKKKMAELYGGFGWVMKRINLDDAIKYMQSGISIARENNFKNELKDLYNNYGVLKQWKNELDSAVYYFDAGLKIKRDLKDDFGVPYSLSNLAGAYLAKKEHERAAELLKESIELRRILQDSVGLGENFTQLAEVYYDEQKLEEALQLFKRSVRIAIDKEYRKLEQFNYNYISDIYQQMNQADSALFYYKKYVEVKDEMFTESQEAKISELTIAYETEKKELALAESKIKIQRKNLLLYMSLAGIVLLGLIGYLIYNQQRTKNTKLKKEIELKTALAKIETQNKLEEQRLRISRDLHDNIGSQLTFVISSLQYIQYQKKLKVEDIKNRVNDIGNFTQQTIHELRDTIWAMNKEKIALSDLLGRLKNFINQLNIKENISVDISKSLEPNIDNIVFSALDGIHVYRIIQESTNNAIKHAEADTITISFNKEDDMLSILISDNGKGFELNLVKESNGLKNLQKRADKLDAEIIILSEKELGTSVRLRLKIDKLMG
jgi:signal transduction histidine kinase